MGNDSTAKSAPFNRARDMMAAMMVVADANPRLPVRRIDKKSHRFGTDTFIRITNRGTITISRVKRRAKLNRNFPKRTMPGVATILNTLTVLLSSSFTKTWASPDMEEKNMISQKRDEAILGLREDAPKEKLTTASVVRANMRMALRA